LAWLGYPRIQSALGQIEHLQRTYWFINLPINAAKSATFIALQFFLRSQTTEPHASQWLTQIQ
jgi:hypothetical protein